MRCRSAIAPHASFVRAIAALVPLLLMFQPRTAGATFHLNEISKIMVGLNGNNTIQAVEIKMLFGLQNAVTGGSIKAYDASGALIATLGTFTGPVPSGISGRKILCATHNFAVAFGITPDLVITPGIPVGTGQVSFELPTCLVNAVAYGAVTVPKNGTTSAAALVADGVAALVRSVDDGTVATCPLSEDAAARFQLAAGTGLSPITFTNNAGATASVSPSVAGVNESPVVSAALRVYPNPFSAEATIEAPGGGRLAVYDVSGRRVRSWSSPSANLGASPLRRIDWDGTDAAGHRLASGIYFVQLGESVGRQVRVVLLR